MNIKKLISLSSLVLCLSFEAARASEPVEEFRGNWTKSFTLVDGSTVTHTPNSTQVGFMTGGKGITLSSKSYNGFPMKTALILSTNSSEPEFIAALKSSGLLKEK